MRNLREESELRKVTESARSQQMTTMRGCEKLSVMTRRFKAGGSSQGAKFRNVKEGKTKTYTTGTRKHNRVKCL